MSKAPASQHLKELRTRGLIVAIFFILGACLAYGFQGPVIDSVLAPLKGQKLVYLNVTGGFNFIFMISIYAGIALALPVLIQQLYAFIRPALPEAAQQKSAKLILGSFVLLLCGMAFGYFVAVPNALVFLYSFADNFIDASLTADSYLSFVMAYTVGIGVVFQIPLILLLINSIKPFTPSGLFQSEKWVIVISFIVAAIITPTPDPINQSIIAGPVIVIYQVGVIIILHSIYKKRRAEKRLRKKELAAQRLSKKRGMTQVPASILDGYKTPEPIQTPRPVSSHAAQQHTPYQARPQVRPPVMNQMKPMQPKQQPYVQPVAKPFVQPIAKPVTQPIAQVPIYSQPAPKKTQSMDGFVTRPTKHQVVVPKRVQPQPVVRAIPRPASPNQRNFTIDGMYRPFPPQPIM
jgi:sec-independent protein translocase protein TatC